MDGNKIILAKSKLSDGFLHNEFDKLKEGMLNLFEIIEEHGKKLDAGFSFKKENIDEISVAVILLEMDIKLGDLVKGETTEKINSVLNLIKKLGELFLIDVESISKLRKESNNETQAETSKVTKEETEQPKEEVTKEEVQKTETEQPKEEVTKEEVQKTESEQSKEETEQPKEEVTKEEPKQKHRTEIKYKKRKGK